MVLTKITLMAVFVVVYCDERDIIDWQRGHHTPTQQNPTTRLRWFPTEQSICAKYHTYKESASHLA